jgi:hypothetical protein
MKCPVGAWRGFDACFPPLAASATSRGDQPLKGRHYFAQKAVAHPRRTPPDEFLVAAEVGSQDLNKSSLVFVAKKQ